jgi:peptidoglycan/LPS O-acetylase OafA/YrhL
MQYYRELDGLRALSVIAVMISHWILVPVIQKLGLGFWGVNFFFVLSGFLITEILLTQIYSKRPSAEILKKFYLKRTLRIFPIYYLVVFIAFLFNIDNGRGLLGYNLTYTLNFYNVFSGNRGEALSHLWSLCVEEQFYLLWPILLLVVSPRYHKKLIITTILVAIVFKLCNAIINLHGSQVINYVLMPSCMDALCLGALLAYLKLNEPTALKKILNKYYVPIIAAASYFAIAFLLPSVNMLSQTLSRFLTALTSFFIIGACIYNKGGGFSSWLNASILQYLGKISYGLYLYHLILSTVLKYWLGDAIRSLFPHSAFLQYNTFVLEAPVYFLLTVSAATLSYYLIEINFLKLKAKAENRWQQKSILQSSAVVELPNDMQNISPTRDN